MPKRELRLGDARLHAERLDQHVPRPADRLGHVVEPHVAEPVEPPGFHSSTPSPSGVDRLRSCADRSKSLPRLRACDCGAVLRNTRDRQTSATNGTWRHQAPVRRRTSPPRQVESPRESTQMPCGAKKFARRTRIAAAAPAGQQLPAAVTMSSVRGRGRVRVSGPTPGVEAEFGDVNPVFVVDKDLAWTGDVGPCRHEVAVGRESCKRLFSRSATVHHAIPIDRDAVRRAIRKPPGPASWLAPQEESSSPSLENL